ncbi:MAG: glycolate oxidase subunit GlcE [Pseudomonadota bacterium]|jgi:glycolate oxidase FAD binding subunit
MDTTPALQALIDQVRAARTDGQALDIQGGNTKRFYGETPAGRRLDLTPFRGITNHQPSELVVTVRAGTPLAELEAALLEHGQCLPFEPPHFGPGGTVGGMVAAGLSGPARASVGAVRDYVLGATVLNGNGEVLSFGGQVIKNVAGYDVSRVMAGSLGTLGVLLEVSLKVLPVAPATATVRFELDEISALAQLNEWGGAPLPLNASAWWDNTLLLRLRGALAAVQAALGPMKAMGGQVIEATHGSPFWHGMRDHTDEYFAKALMAVERGVSLWRLSVPQTAPPLRLSGEQLIEWHGGQRWWCTAAPAAQVRQAAAAVGGHATLFHGKDKSPGVFTPLHSPLDRLHRQMKAAFDPHGVFNPGRLYPGL